MVAKEEELVKVKERQLQTEEQLKDFETKQQQVRVSVTKSELNPALSSSFCGTSVKEDPFICRFSFEFSCGIVAAFKSVNSSCVIMTS